MDARALDGTSSARTIAHMRLSKLVTLSLRVGCAASANPGATSYVGDGKADGNGISTSQPAAAAKTEAARVIWLLDRSNAKSIECKTADGKKITIAKGDNTEDDTGLVITGD